MSLTRRLKRLVRAQWGALRGDAVADETAGSPSGEAAADDEAAAPNASAERRPEVPPDVADAYRALEVPVGSDRAAVKAAYRRLMKRYHQDRFENDPERRETAGEVSKRLNLAYDRILEYLDREDG